MNNLPENEPDPQRARPTVSDRRGRQRNMTRLELMVVRLTTFAGILGLGTALGAFFISQDVAGWITGLIIALVSFILTSALWAIRSS